MHICRESSKRERRAATVEGIEGADEENSIPEKKTRERGIERETAYKDI